MINSEKEMNKGFADLYLEPYFPKYTDMTHSYVIEVKYIKRSIKDENSDKQKLTDKVAELVTDATTQLNTYAKDEYVLKTKKDTELRKLILVYHGWELIKFLEV